jgi:hypothetical protein
VDPALLILPLLASPPRAGPAALHWPGALLPITIPVTAVASGRRVGWLCVDASLPLAERVRLGLAWGEPAQVFRLIAADPRGPAADSAVADLLAGWTASELRRHRLTTERGLLVVGADGAQRPPNGDERGALGDVAELLAPIGSRWIGPLLLVPYGLDHPAIAPGQGRVLRPALPVLRPPADPPGRASLAAAIAGLLLDLAAPPAAGWPGWLQQGIAGCVQARADGDGLAPRTMRDRRAAAGPAAIAALLAGTTADPALATALVQPLLTAPLRSKLPTLLDRLRRGETSATALREVCGLDAKSLARAW